MSSKKPSQKNGINPLEEIVNSLVEVLTLILNRAVEKGIPFIVGTIRDFIAGKSSIPKIEREMLKKINKQVAEDSNLGWSINAKRPIGMSEIELARHIMVVGGSGWGKSSLLKILFENEIKQGFPVVVIDPKGSLEDLQTFRKICSYHKRKLWVFSDNYAGPEARNMNPFRELEDTKILAFLMRILNFDGTNSYYIAKAQQFISEALSKITQHKLVPSLPLIYSIIKTMHGNNSDAEGLLAQLQVICESSLGKNLSDEDHDPAVNMTEAIEQGYCLYISLSTQAYGDFARLLGRMFTNEVLQISAYRNSNSVNPLNDFKPFTFIIEEAGSMIEPDFLDLVNKARSSGTRIIALVQSIFDFDRVENGLVGILAESFSTFFFSRQIYSKSTEEISKIIGTDEDVKQTKQTKEEAETGGGSIREVEKYRVHPNILRDVGISQFIYVKLGSKKEVHLINVKNPNEMQAFSKPLSPPVIKIYKREYVRKNQNFLKSSDKKEPVFISGQKISDEKPKLF